MVLSSAALPIRAVQHRAQEKRSCCVTIYGRLRDAIDRYKDLADANKIRVEVGSEGYPPDLETLVTGVKLGAGDGQENSILRRIPVDPMTGASRLGLARSAG